MRRIISLGIAAFLAFTLLLGSEVLADRYLQLLLRGNYYLAYEMQSVRAKGLYNVEEMEREFQQLRDEYGNYLLSSRQRGAR